MERVCGRKHDRSQEAVAKRCKRLKECLASITLGPGNVFGVQSLAVENENLVARIGPAKLIVDFSKEALAHCSHCGPIMTEKHQCEHFSGLAGFLAADPTAHELLALCLGVDPAETACGEVEMLTQDQDLLWNQSAASPTVSTSMSPFELASSMRWSPDATACGPCAPTSALVTVPVGPHVPDAGSGPVRGGFDLVLDTSDMFL